MDCYSTNFSKFVELCYNLNMIKRFYEPLEPILRPNKVLLIYGPRRVGKTTLLQQTLAGTKLNYKLDSGDNIRTQQILSSQDFQQILSYIEGYELLAIDEAQNIPNIGMGLLAKRDFRDINFRKSIMAGDSISDMQFGKRLGMTTIFISSNIDEARQNSRFINYLFPDLISFAESLNRI